MENNKTYLRHFGLLFLSFALVSAFITWHFYARRSDPSDQIQWLTTLVQILPSVIILAAVGYSTGFLKKGLIAAVVSIALKLLLFYLKPGSNSESANPSTWFWLQQLTFFAPYIFFLLLTNPAARRIPLMLSGILLLYGDNNMFMAVDGIERVFRVFRWGWDNPYYLFYFLPYVISMVIHFILLCELVNYGKDKAAGWQPKLLNPGNEYSKGNATILFWSLKLFLLLSVIGSPIQLESFIRHLSSDESYYIQYAGFLKWYYLLSLGMTLPLLFLAAWYLRKFLAEFFIGWRQTSRLLYWFLLLPIIGFIGWLVMLADAEKNTRFEERKRTLEDFAASSKNGIITVFMILLGLRFLLTISSNPAGAFIMVLISAVLFYAMATSLSGYYFNLYLNIAVQAIIFLVAIYGKGKGEGNDLPLLFFPLILYNIIQIILMLPSLHIESFSYDSRGEEEAEGLSPEGDLFH